MSAGALQRIGMYLARGSWPRQAAYVQEFCRKVQIHFAYGHTPEAEEIAEALAFVHQYRSQSSRLIFGEDSPRELASRIREQRTRAHLARLRERPTDASRPYPQFRPTRRNCSHQDCGSAAMYHSDYCYDHNPE
ncbi:hypothetical protein [Hymenobacter sp. DG25A]|jgi:hypothetical protein|uniref:hypothetical protein n=1 Tax=Hymenobacter sp. DG25A TaxID=1385663 RepID=UPI0006BCB9A2|nr:hypothetical protein [Hymenobacter sp. DG25A]ALD20007.1 hypothetical protein AM218_00665 [Hymenobacter sp. DG25A]